MLTPAIDNLHKMITYHKTPNADPLPIATTSTPSSSTHLIKKIVNVNIFKLPSPQLSDSHYWHLEPMRLGFEKKMGPTHVIKKTEDSINKLQF